MLSRAGALRGERSLLPAASPAFLRTAPHRSHPRGRASPSRSAHKGLPAVPTSPPPLCGAAAGPAQRPGPGMAASGRSRPGPLPAGAERCVPGEPRTACPCYCRCQRRRSAPSAPFPSPPLPSPPRRGLRASPSNGSTAPTAPSAPRPRQRRRLGPAAPAKRVRGSPELRAGPAGSSGPGLCPSLRTALPLHGSCPACAPKLLQSLPSADWIKVLAAEHPQPRGQSRAQGSAGEER